MNSPREIAPGLVIQGFTPPLRLEDFRLVAFDMDSTLINIECVDEIADAAGRKEEVAAITEAAMRGEITDYKDSLRKRVALLRGVTVADMEQVYTERLQLNPGAAELGVWGATEQKVHLSPAPARKPLWRLVSSGKPSFCRTIASPFVIGV